MSDTTQPEDTQVDPGAQTVPTDVVSGAPETLSSDTVTLADLSQTVQSLTDEMRGLQGKQDKGEDATKTYGERLAGLEAYHQARLTGATEEQVEREMLIDDIIAERSGKQAPAGSRQSVSSETVNELFQAAGLDSSKDPQVAELYRQGADVGEFAKLVVTRVKQQSNPQSDAQLPPAPPDAPSSGGDSADEVITAYKRELGVATGQGREQVLKVRAKYRKLGLNL